MLSKGNLMKKTVYIFVMIMSIHCFIQPAAPKKIDPIVPYYAGILCEMITLQCCAIKAQQLKPEGPIESIADKLPKTKEDFIPALTSHPFTKLKDFAPTDHLVKTKSLKMNQLKPTQRELVYSTVFAQLPAVSLLVHAATDSITQNPEAWDCCEAKEPQGWQKDCSVEQLKKFIQDNPKTTLDKTPLHTDSDKSPWLSSCITM
jgi:hypothetical protein